MVLLEKLNVSTCCEYNELSPIGTLHVGTCSAPELWHWKWCADVYEYIATTTPQYKFRKQRRFKHYESIKREIQWPQMYTPNKGPEMWSFDFCCFE